MSKIITIKFKNPSNALQVLYPKTTLDAVIGLEDRLLNIEGSLLSIPNEIALATLKTGTDTTAGIISSKNLKDAIVHHSPPPNLTNYVTRDTTQTITAAKTFEGTAITIYSRRKNDSAGIYAGMMMERDTTSSGTSAPATFGIGGYFKAKNTSGSMAHAGLFGGRLTPAVDGETTQQVGEVVFSPAWNNADPHQRADFRIRATSSSNANVYLTGDFYANASSSGKNGKKIATEEFVEGKGYVTTDTKYTAGTNISINGSNQISATDTKYTAGTNISINGSNQISATDTKYSAATTSSAGLMSAADKTNLNTLMSTWTANDGELVDKIEEVLTAFQNFPESYNLLAQLNSKALDSAVVKLFGDQEITGTKTFKGINTTDANLVIDNSAARPHMTFKRADYNDFNFSRGYGDFSIDSQGSNYLFRIKPNGNVGIGISTSGGPQYKLDVNGDVNIASGKKYKINGVNLSASDVGALDSNSTLAANKLSGAITNGVTATTQSQKDDSHKVATTKYVDTAVSQADLPSYLKRDGTNSMTGTLNFNDKVTISYNELDNSLDFVFN